VFASAFSLVTSKTSFCVSTIHNKGGLLMELMQRIKTMTREQVANSMVNLVNHVSPDNFMRLSLMASHLIGGEDAGAAVDAVIDSLKQGENGQATKMFRRVMTELPPHCLRAVARNLFVNGLLGSSAM